MPLDFLVCSWNITHVVYQEYDWITSSQERLVTLNEIEKAILVTMYELCPKTNSIRSFLCSWVESTVHVSCCCCWSAIIKTSSLLHPTLGILWLTWCCRGSTPRTCLGCWTKTIWRWALSKPLNSREGLARWKGRHLWESCRTWLSRWSRKCSIEF